MTASERSLFRACSENLFADYVAEPLKLRSHPFLYQLTNLTKKENPIMLYTRPILTVEAFLLSFTFFGCFIASPLARISIAAETNESTPLEVAVRKFNENSKTQLTIDEVVGALENWDPTKYAVSDESKQVLAEVSARFDEVASTRQLPSGSEFYTSIDWTKSQDGLKEVKSTDLCLGIRSAGNRMDAVVIRTEKGESRPAPSEGFGWKLAPGYPKTSFVNDSYSFFVARDAEQEVTTIFCALSSGEFHNDARLVAFDRRGKRLATHGLGGEIFDGITMKMYQFPKGTQGVALVGIEVPIAHR